MTKEFFVRMVKNQDLKDRDQNVFAALSTDTKGYVKSGCFIIKSWDMYHDEDGDLVENEEWHPEFGIFLNEQDAQKRLKDLEVSSRMKDVFNIFQEENASQRSRSRTNV